MDWFRTPPLEPGLLRIFRIFTLAVSLFFFLFYGFPTPVYEVFGPYREMLRLLGIGYALLTAYLSFTQLQRVFKSLYLPVAILASIFIPIGCINWAPQSAEMLSQMSQAVQPINSWTVTILLLFPLILTAWQYSFNIVLFFFAVLGIIDPMISIFIYEEGSQGLYLVIYASAVRITAFTAIGYIITELMKDQRSRREDLAEANRKLRAYARQVREMAVVRERNRLASELHDVLAHTLSGLTVHLEAIDAVIPPEQEHLHEEIERAVESAREGLKETRRALKNLRSEPLETYGMIQAIEQMIEQYSQRGEFVVDLQFSSSATELSEHQEQNLYRIIQECLENILHHARASEVNVLFLRKGSRGLQVIVDDNGIGFQPGQVDSEHHFGLSSIRDRVSRMGGEVEIISPVPESTSGSRVSIIIPLEKHYDPHYHL